MRRRQINQMREAEKRDAAKPTEIVPVPKDNRKECPKCGKRIKPRGYGTHLLHCKGDE